LYDVKTGVLVAVACRYTDTAVQICMQLLIFACLIIILIIIIIITTTNNNNKNDYFENYCKAP